MTSRVLLIIAVSAILVGSSSLTAREKQWDPTTAVSDARRDIAKHRIRFCFIGGYAPHPVGVPIGSDALVARYPHIKVGDQGCQFTAHSDAEHEYARLYNEEMWRYVSVHPH
jgi:hypothetical protein